MRRDDATRRDDAERQRRKRARDAAGLAAPRCGAVTRSGERCRLPAGHGVPGVSTGPCSRHGGHLPRVHVAAQRNELLAEARAWATGQDLDAGEAVMAMMRAAAAHAVLVERRLLSLPPDDLDVLAWHRTLDAVQRTAAETAARVVSLGLEERRQRMAEATAGAIAAAFRDALAEVADSVLTSDARRRILRTFSARLAVLESTAADLTDPTTITTGALAA